MIIKRKILLFTVASCLIGHSVFIHAEAKTKNNNNQIAANQNNLDRVVAVVNDDVITNKELTREVNKYKKQMNVAANQLPPVDVIRKKVLNQIILDNLQLQMAEMNNMSATDEQINQAMDNIAKQNNVNIFALKDVIAREGIDFNEFRADLKKQLTIMNVQKAVVHSDITISEQELKQALEQLKKQNNHTRYRLSHILISVPDEPNTEQIKFAKNKAMDIYHDLINGKDFNKTAKVVSDAQNALEGGDLGWLGFSELPSTFTDIVPTLKKNQISKPFQTESGFHIVKLVDLNNDNTKYTETRYKARHILIKKDSITDSNVAKHELKKIKQEVQRKNNFSELALIYSDDHGSASQGGELGWVAINSLVPEFGAVLESLKENEISPPFETVYGWHIVQLEAKKEVDNTAQVQETIAKNMLAQKKSQDALAMWQNRIRNQAHIKILI